MLGFHERGRDSDRVEWDGARAHDGMDGLKVRILMQRACCETAGESGAARGARPT